MERRRIKGVTIPKEIWYNNNLTIAEKCILVEIKNTQEEIHDCVVGGNFCVVYGSKITNNYIANFAQISVRSVTNILAKLQELNYIIIKNGNSAQRIIIYNESENEEITTQNFLCCKEKRKKSKKRKKEIVSKKVNKKIIIQSMPAHTYERQPLESYEEVLDGLEVHGLYRISIFEFIRHLQANGCKVINARLESLVIALDRQYKRDDIGKCAEIKSAITNGYKRLPCEQEWQ